MIRVTEKISLFDRDRFDDRGDQPRLTLLELCEQLARRRPTDKEVLHQSADLCLDDRLAGEPGQRRCPTDEILEGRLFNGRRSGGQ